MKRFYDSHKSNLREKVLSGESSNEVHETFMMRVGKMPKGCKVLDIGTGNGYILSEIDRRFPGQYNLFGVDISPEMLRKAEELIGKKARLYLADNHNLPFPNSSFSIVTAKNVTNFSPNELSRVLEGNGLFVYREYGKGKGLVEIAECFKERLVRSFSPDFYASQLKQEGFKDIHIQEYSIPKKYDLDNLVDIIQMFPFIDGLSESDLNRIHKLYEGQKEITITSDPFILTARRKR